MTTTVALYDLHVTVYGPEAWDFEDKVLEALEGGGFPATVERLRRPDSGSLAITYRVSTHNPAEVAAQQVAEALASVPVTEALISER